MKNDTQRLMEAYSSIAQGDNNNDTVAQLQNLLSKYKSLLDEFKKTPPRSELDYRLLSGKETILDEAIVDLEDTIAALSGTSAQRSVETHTFGRPSDLNLKTLIGKFKQMSKELTRTTPNNPHDKAEVRGQMEMVGDVINDLSAVGVPVNEADNHSDQLDEINRRIEELKADYPEAVIEVKVYYPSRDNEPFKDKYGMLK